LAVEVGVQLRRTPLNAAHRELGAKMVDFAGWDMPLHYGSQIDEHRSVRSGAGMFDVSHMLAIDVNGASAAALLRLLFANDVTRLREPGHALYSCMLNHDGGVIDDLIVYFLSPQHYRVVVNAGTADKDVAWISEVCAAHAPDTALTPRRDLALIAVQGPHARELFWAEMPGLRPATEALAPFRAAHFGEMLVARTGYTGEDGFEIMLPAGQAVQLWRQLHARGVTPAGLGARDTLRLEAGMNLYGQDMDETTDPRECGLGWTLALQDERDFIGKAALRARSVERGLVGLVLDGKGVMRAHQPVITASGAGEITSGGFAPTLNRSIALARVPLAAANDATVEVEIRNQRVGAHVVKPPFVRHGKILVAA
jgi:aminomethyltransferase